jgi:hypothetical protein
MKCKANKTGCRKEFAVLDVKRKRRNIELARYMKEQLQAISEAELS